jgi:hypothetical protein
MVSQAVDAIASVSRAFEPLATVTVMTPAEGNVTEAILAPAPPLAFGKTPLIAVD